MAKNNKFVKVMAFFALFGIIIGIVGTGILIIFSGGNSSGSQTVTEKQYLEIQELMKAQSGAIVETEAETLSGETN